MRIYLDVSCLNRPGDDQAQARIRLETEAISIIFDRFASRGWRHLASDMVIIEINAATDLRRRHRAAALLPDRASIAPLTDAIWARADQCEKMGFEPADAVHLAAAEAMQADVLLTCDDRMLKTGVRNASRLRVSVANPLKWLEEYDNDSDAR